MPSRSNRASAVPGPGMPGRYSFFLSSCVACSTTVEAELALTANLAGGWRTAESSNRGSNSSVTDRTAAAMSCPREEIRLRMLHLNDSKTPMGSNRDRH